MSDTNEMINTWLINEFRTDKNAGTHSLNRRGFYTGDTYTDETTKHLQACDTLRVTECDSEWDCGCYSSWTRDDTWRMAVHFACDHDLNEKWQVSDTWADMLDEIKEYDRESFRCRIEERRNEGSV